MHESSQYRGRALVTVCESAYSEKAASNPQRLDVILTLAIWERPVFSFKEK